MESLQCNLDLLPQSHWNTVNATATAKSSLIYAQEIGVFWAGPNYFTTRENLPSYLVKLTVDGCGVLDYDGQSYTVPIGHFFWIDCTKHHYYRTDPGAGSWHMLWVHFYGANAQSYHEAFLSSNHGSPVSASPVGMPIYDTISNILALDCSGENQLQTDLYASSLLTQLASQCVLATMVAQKNDDIPQIIQAVRMHLQNHYREKHTLEALGAQFNINPHYLQKQFKRYIGQSPTEFLIFLRISRAKELMRSSRRPIGEIAYAVGMENLGYFTRLFRQREGMTPQEYRKQWPVLEHGLTGAEE